MSRPLFFKRLTISVVLGGLGLASGAACQSYTQKSEEMRTLMRRGQYSKALEELDESDIATQDRNRVLYLMERGTLLYLSKEYELAAKEWRKASEVVDSLYTTSLSATAASFAVNDSYSDYQGELHEKVLLPTFAALAYLAQGNPQGARVEVRRLDEVMKLLETEGKKSDQPEYARDAFAHYLAALVYEAFGEWDSAIIEYRRGLDSLYSSTSWNDDKISASAFADPLCRLARLRNRKDIVEETRQDLSSKSACKGNQKGKGFAEIVVFYENGRSPIKEAQDIVLPIQGQVLRVSYPTYTNLSYRSRGATITVNGNRAGRTKTIQDIGYLARKSLEARRVVDVIKMGARVLAKDQAARAAGRALGPLAGLAASIVGAVTETADTRGWTSLPDEIEVFRTVVPAGKKVSVDVTPDYGKPLRFTGTLKSGELKFLRLRTFY